MLAYIIGVVLFALGIGLAVALHEAGHMLTAKMFGMKVRRYFIGFGPKIFSFRRGETEYGLKVIPAGGFCDIAGMTALDEVTPDEAPRAMWRYPVWKRFIVLVAGSVTHFILGFIILYLMAITTGLINVQDTSVVSGVANCAQSISNVHTTPVTYAPCKPGQAAPAKDAGLLPGDVIVSVAGKPTPTWTDVSAAVQKLRGTVPFVVQRNGNDLTLQVHVATVLSIPADQQQSANPKLAQVGAIGVTHSSYITYGPLGAIGGTFGYTGQMFVGVWDGIKELPGMIPNLVTSIGGGQRNPNGVMSVVGAARLGGQTVEDGAWSVFWLLLASLQFFFGAFNLLPLLPLDGGHIAVAFYERIRNWLRALRGRPLGNPVDYTKLAPLTVLVVVVFGAMVLLSVTADIVNPIRLGG
ncbi:MAG TPA: site-2 protease family protein [Pseudonocardiaceae bacterium]|nr:site-2 protease family protein [Pseudonocardiaceae bacterium]